MAFENFLTYTEVDNGNDVTVATNTITVVNQARDIDNHVSKNFGAGHFGDFEHLHSFKLTASSSSATGLLYAVTNTVDDVNGLWSKECIFAYINSSTTADRLLFYQRNLLGAVSADSYLTLTLNQQYWCTTSRVGTTIQMLLYDNEARTSLVDTLSFTGEVQTYQYAMPQASYNKPSGIGVISYISSDLDLQEPPPVSGALQKIAGIFGIGKLGLR